MDSLLQDLRYAVRTLARERGFTLVAVLTLALGVGASTSVFSVVDALLLEPFAFPRLERLVLVTEQSATWDRLSLSAADLAEVEEGIPGLEQVGAFSAFDTNLTGDGEPERLFAYQGTPEAFSALGVAPALGRTFLPEEGTAGHERVVLLGWGVWQRRFGGRADVLGRSLVLDGHGHTVVGVMPDDFRFPKAAQLWVPLVLTPEERAARAPHRLVVVGRLAEGASLEEVDARLRVLGERLREESPGGAHANALGALALGDYTDPATRHAVWVMMASVVLLLLVACANVAGMLVARAARRERELAVRVSLGAGRGRLVRQLLTESALLAVGGGALGLLLALWGMDLLRAGMPAEVARWVPGWERIGLDGRVLAFTSATLMLSTLAFGLLPALRASQVDPGESMRSEGRGASGGAGRQRLRQVLVAAQVALALMMGVGAVLFVRSFRSMLETPLGFEPDRLLTLQLEVAEAKYPTDADVVRFYDGAAERLAALPGVTAVGAVTHVPLSGISTSAPLQLEGAEALPAHLGRSVLLQGAGETSFQALGLPLRAGRGFLRTDTQDAPLVAVVSESLARELAPDGSALGRRIALERPGSTPRWRTVVGVVGDVQHHQPADAREDHRTVYLPHRQTAERGMSLVLRTERPPASLVPAVRQALRAHDSEQPAFELKPMEQVHDEALVGPRYVLVLLTLFAGLALALCAVGTYSVTAYAAGQRAREFGIRLALGAHPSEVARLVLRQGLLPTLAGVGVGLAGAWALTRGMASLLVGVSALDPLAFGAMVVLLALLSLLAALAPARQAARIDPASSLRAD